MARRRPNYEKDLKAELKDRRFAAEYLNAALQDDEAVFLLALRDVVEAHRISSVARRAKLNRETLYRTLSGSGNPTLRTLTAIFEALGLKLSITPKGNAPQIEVASKDEGTNQTATKLPTHTVQRWIRQPLPSSVMVMPLFESHFEMGERWPRPEIIDTGTAYYA